MGDMVFAVMGTILLGGFFWLTWINSRRHAYILLAIAAASIVVAQIKGVQLLSLLGILGMLGVMVASRFAREKSILQWLAHHGFAPAQFNKGPALFPNLSTQGSVSYAHYKVRIAGMPCLFTERRQSYRSGNTSSLVVHCAYYFSENANTDALEATFLKHKSNTPKANWRKSQLGYFNLSDYEVFKPAMGGIVVSWRLPATIKGFSERYEWVKQALGQ
jgi:hypothetical protein